MKKFVIENNELVFRIPLRQHKNNPYDPEEEKGLSPNVVGVIAGQFEQGIYNVNDLSYKDSLQLGVPVIMTYMDNDKFRKLCKELGLDVWEYPDCVECKKTLWGTHTMNKKGNICFECENKK